MARRHQYQFKLCLLFFSPYYQTHDPKQVFSYAFEIYFIFKDSPFKGGLWLLSSALDTFLLAVFSCIFSFKVVVSLFFDSLGCLFVF